MAPRSPRTIQIDGHTYTLFRDEDRGNFRFLRFTGKVTWIEKRVQWVLIDPCRTAFKEAEENYLGLVLVTAVCAGISASSRFMHGNLEKWRGQSLNDKRRFLRFVRKYMPELNQRLNDETWGEWLYSKVRCGLAHGFTIENGGVKVDLGQYLKPDRREPLIDPALLLDDFERGWVHYLDDVRRAGRKGVVGKRFLERFDSIYRD